VFCHGICADGSCFNKVMPAFQAAGYEVASAQYSLDTNEADVVATSITWVRSAARRSSSAIPTAEDHHRRGHR
jgi:hypothetical protein